jgi:hypothetical protein
MSLEVDAETPPPQRYEIAAFFPDGACRPGRTLYIVSREGDRRAARVRPLTGRLDVRALPTAAEEAAQHEGTSPADALVPFEAEDDR